VIARFDADRVAHGLAVAATTGAAVVVPLLYVPPLASPFTLPKEIAFEIAAALGFCAFVLRSPAGRDRLARKNPQPDQTSTRPMAWAMALVLAGATISAVTAASTPTGAPYALAALGRWAAWFGLACGAAVAAEDAPSRANLLQAVSASAAFVSVIGLLQHVDLFPLPIPVISMPGSTFGNRNLAGEAVALALPLGLGAVASARKPGERRALGGALALQIAYLAATRARGAWIGGVAGMLTFAILNRRPWSRTAAVTVAGIAGVALVVVLVPARANPRYALDAKRLANGAEIVEATFDPDSTALRTRFGLWRRSLVMFTTAPLTGVGPGNWPVFFPFYAEPHATEDGVLSSALAPRHAHNDLVEVLAETGLIGLLALVFLGIAAGVTIHRQLRRDPADTNRRASISAAGGTLVALVGAGVTGFPMEMPCSLAFGALALGFIWSTKSRHDLEPARPLVLDRIFAALAVAGLVIAAGAGERRIRANAWLGVAESALHGDPGPNGAGMALDALDRAQRAGGLSFRVALRRAHATLRLRRTDESAQAAQAALSEEPYSPNAWAALAAAQLGEGYPVLSRATADQALALLNDYPYALFVKAKAAEAIGDHDAAETAWERLVTLAHPAWPDKETSDAAAQLLRARDGTPAK
jgi:O-antigen ligase